MIELVDISKKFKDVTILENVNLIFEDGKRYYLKGINGSGKSVLLKLIVGYLKPNSGYVAIDGEKLGNRNEFIKDAGVFINSPEFLDSLTGLQNLEYLGKIRRRVDTGYRDHLIERLGLSEDINKSYSAYSLGMKQKLRIIQAMMEKPKYLIMDEPLNALDEDSRSEMINIVDEYLSCDNTLIYTSHEYEAEDIFNGEVVEVKNRTAKRYEKNK